MGELSNTDYKKILEYYKENIPKSSRLLKINAEKIISTKLCRCIKKVDKQNEGRAIGICTKTILNRKGLSRGNFKCKGNGSIKLKKNKSKKNVTRRKQTTRLL
jgi:hypothetical protein